MAYWWDTLPAEKYWVEITDRPDVGADLKCPQADESSKPYWSYYLIRDIQPGDIIFHYWTPKKAFVGASVAGGPLEERPISWVPHGTYGRARETHNLREGWWLPVYGYTEANTPLTLEYANHSEEQVWIRQWVSTMKERAGSGLVAAPFQLYPGKLRGQQGYIAKMPLVFVERWPQLSELAASLSTTEDKLSALAESHPEILNKEIAAPEFKPKSAEEYSAFIRGGVQRRSRNHEKLIGVTADFFRSRGVIVSNPHPIDLLLHTPLNVIIEAKVVGNRSAGFAIREAVGQLHEYKFFIGPKDAKLCILLDAKPEEHFIPYTEEQLGIMIIWESNGALYGGPNSVSYLPLA